MVGKWWRFLLALQGLKVFTAVDGHGAVGVVTDVAIGLPERLWEFIHHHPTVFSVGDLAHQRWQRNVTKTLPFAPKAS